MKITIRRSGGFAGGTETLASLELASLPGPAGAAIREALAALKSQAADFHPVGADFLKYEVTVENDAANQSMTIADDGSEKARSLIAIIDKIVAAAKGR